MFNTLSRARNRGCTPPALLRCCERAAALFNAPERWVKFLRSHLTPGKLSARVLSPKSARSSKIWTDAAVQSPKESFRTVNLTLVAKYGEPRVNLSFRGKILIIRTKNGDYYTISCNGLYFYYYAISKFFFDKLASPRPKKWDFLHSRFTNNTFFIYLFRLIKDTIVFIHFDRSIHFGISRNHWGFIELNFFIRWMWKIIYEKILDKLLERSGKLLIWKH